MVEKTPEPSRALKPVAVAHQDGLVDCVEKTPEPSRALKPPIRHQL